jgi:hypothetical protein
MNTRLTSAGKRSNLCSIGSCLTRTAHGFHCSLIPLDGILVKVKFFVASCSAKIRSTSFKPQLRLFGMVGKQFRWDSLGSSSYFAQGVERFCVDRSPVAKQKCFVTGFLH